MDITIIPVIVPKRTTRGDRPRAARSEAAARAMHEMHMAEHGAEWAPESWDGLAPAAREVYRRRVRTGR